MATRDPSAASDGAAPDRLEAYLDRVRALVAADGFAVQHVIGGVSPFSYTIGLTAVGVPELWVAGGSLVPQQAEMLLRDAGEVALRRAPRMLPLGELNLDWSVRFQLRGPVAVDEAAPHIATELYPPPQVVTVLQVLWPDRAGLFPTDDGYDVDHFPQRLLGLRGETL